jgi:hypothetical protein
MLHERASHAEYDDRLVALRRLPEPRVNDGEARRGDPATGASTHVLALRLSRGAK